MTIEKINLSPAQVRLNTQEKIEKATANLKAKGLIHNEILGWATLQEINQCVKDRIITFRGGYYCIPMELKLISRNSEGKLLHNPVKEWVVSQKYLDYMIKTGRKQENAIRRNN